MAIKDMILGKAYSLIEIAERDEHIYGNCFIELNERSIKIIHPKDMIVKIDDSGKIKEFAERLSWEDESIKHRHLAKEMDICMKCGENITRFFGLISRKCKCRRLNK